MDVAVVCGVSQLTAQRDLARLHEARLVRRLRSEEGRTHTWWSEVTAQGAELLSRELAASGRPVPLQLGRRHTSAADNLRFLPLGAEQAGDHGRRQPRGVLIFANVGAGGRLVA